MNKPMRAVLWDLDGVLIDSEPGYYETVGQMVRSLGYPYGQHEFAKVTGTSYKDFADLLALKEPPEKLQALYIEALMSSVQNNVSGLIEGVTGFLDQMHMMGMKMAIGSSSPRQLVEFVVKKFGLWKWIPVIVTGSDTANGKPSPDIYLQCAKLLHVHPHECLVFEDSVNGILSGKNAGMCVCAFSGTNLHNFDLSSADFQIQAYTPETLQEVLRKYGQHEFDNRPYES